MRSSDYKRTKTSRTSLRYQSPSKMGSLPYCPQKDSVQTRPVIRVTDLIHLASGALPVTAMNMRAICCRNSHKKCEVFFWNGETKTVWSDVEAKVGSQRKGKSWLLQLAQQPDIQWSKSVLLKNVPLSFTSVGCNSITIQYQRISNPKMKTHICLY